ncbi:MAG: hypothetical protein WBC70_07950 [Candidatus Aminicenantales bacterium]
MKFDAGKIKKFFTEAFYYYIRRRRKKGGHNEEGAYVIKMGKGT